MGFYPDLLSVTYIALSFGFARRFTLLCFLRGHFIYRFYLRFFLRWLVVFTDALVDINHAIGKIVIVTTSVFFLDLLSRFALFVGTE